MFFIRIKDDSIYDFSLSLRVLLRMNEYLEYSD